MQQKRRTGGAEHHFVLVPYPRLCTTSHRPAKQLPTLPAKPWLQWAFSGAVHCRSPWTSEPSPPPVHPSVEHACFISSSSACLSFCLQSLASLFDYPYVVLIRSFPQDLILGPAAQQKGITTSLKIASCRVLIKIYLAIHNLFLWQPVQRLNKTCDSNGRYQNSRAAMPVPSICILHSLFLKYSYFPSQVSNLKFYFESSTNFA